jgi:hypothetical protein
MFIAAADEQINDDVNLLVSFGGYYDLKNVLKFIATGHYEHQGQKKFHPPDPFGRKLILAQYEKNFGQQESVNAFFNNTNPEQFETLYSSLPEELKNFISDLTPKDHLSKLASKKILLVHSQPVLIVPYTESLKLKESLDNAKVTILTIFSHVNVKFPKPGLKNIFTAYIPETARMYKIIFKILY